MAGEKHSERAARPTGAADSASRRRRTILAVAVLAAFATATAIGYALWDGPAIVRRLSAVPLPHKPVERRPAEPPAPAKPDLRLTREAIDQLLDRLDEARRRKDAAAILRHLAPDAVITVHMKQGAQQQTALLTREEYGATLRMAFTFPSANDYARVSTTVSLAPDERSAKVSFKSAETLRQHQRELKIDGEGTFIVRMREDGPVIVSLEEIVPGDST